jgi:hypothetical protein
MIHMSKFSATKKCKLRLFFDAANLVHDYMR